MVKRNTANCVLRVGKTAKSLKQLTKAEIIELSEPEAEEPHWPNVPVRSDSKSE